MKRISPPDNRDGWYEIDPASAIALFDARRKNRRLRPGHAERIAADIRAGIWTQNGESIVLDPQGKLLDGQHRLRAVAITGKAIVAYVVHLRSTSESTFDSIDQGRPRTIADRMQEEDVPNYVLASAVVRMIVLGFGTSGKGSHTRSLKLSPAEIRTHYGPIKAEVDLAVARIAELSASLKGFLPTSIAAYVYFNARKENPEAADKFIDAVATGVELARTNPALVLRNRLMEIARAKAKMPHHETLAIAIKAWCAFRDRKAAKIMKWDSKREAYPSFGEIQP